MLTPHEFATLMLVKDSPDQIDSQRVELGTLLEQQLIAWEKLASGRQHPHLTNEATRFSRPSPVSGERAPSHPIARSEAAAPFSWMV